MKILLIADNHSETAGGAEKSFFDLKKRLKNLPKTEVISLGFGDKTLSSNDAYIIHSGIAKAASMLWRFITHPLKYYQIKKIIRQINPDIIHFHNIRQFTPTLLKAAKGYPSLQTAHDFSAICPTSWNLHKDLTVCETGFNQHCWKQHRRNKNPIIYAGLVISFLIRQRLLKKQVAAFVSPSPFLATYLTRNHFPSIYIPPFVEPCHTTNFEKLRKNEFLFIGQIAPHKGIEELIDEFAIACQQNNNLVLKIAGKGKLEHHLKQKVKSLGLEKNIIFLGWQKTDTLYPETSALIFPSIGLEAFGLVITEAMSQARAVIGSNRGPTTWLIEDKKTGLLFDPLKKGDLAEKILFFASNPELAEQYGKQAHEKLAAFPSDKEILSELIHVYQKVIDAKKGA